MKAINEHDNIIKSVILSSITILLLIGMYSVTSYAWFYTSLKNEGNKIESGKYIFSVKYSESLNGEYLELNNRVLSDNFESNELYLKISNIGKDKEHLEFKYYFSNDVTVNSDIEISTLTESINIPPIKQDDAVKINCGEEHIYKIDLLNINNHEIKLYFYTAFENSSNFD